MTRASARSITLVASFLLAAGIGVPAAHAAPSVPKPQVYQHPCGDNAPVCRTSGAPTVKDGEVVTEKVQIDVTVTTSYPLTLEWVEVQARADGDWFCIRRWTASGTSFNRFFNWDTEEFPNEPSGCESSASEWGDRTSNSEVDLRVLAADSNAQRTSETLSVVLSNRPESTAFVGEPRVIGDRTSSARVQLTWDHLADEDVSEYRLVRVDPDGGESELPFDAIDPGRDDCSLSAGRMTCTDDSIPSKSYGGRYTYSVIAFRKTQATSGTYVERCARSSGYCIASPISTSRSATLSDPEPRTTPTRSSPTPSPTVSETPEERREREARVLSDSFNRPTYNPEFYQGTYDSELPFDEGVGLFGGGLSEGNYFGGSQGGPFAASPAGYLNPPERNPTPYRATAGGLLMLLVAAHMGRALSRSARH